MLDSYIYQNIETNGIKLHVVAAGHPANKPIILLHGFPEFYYGWHKQIDYLVDNGFYVIVPDQRGYNLSDKPKGVKNYHIDLLAKDIIGLMQVFGYQQINIAAHDWGGVVAWWIATHYPETIEKLMVLNAPHPNNLNDLREFSPSQLLKSWYILYFQLPSIPEWGIGRSNNSFREFMVGNRPKSFTEEDFEIYEKAWSQPHAITSTINWYRAAFRYLFPSRLPKDESIHMPVRIVWGAQDKFLGKPLAERAMRLCSNAELFFIPSASHWIAHDEPDIVNQNIVEFF